MIKNEKLHWTDSEFDRTYCLEYCYLLPNSFYCATRLHSADYAVARCPSVRPSVCLSHADILSTRLYISSNFFTVGYRPRHSSFSIPNGIAIFRWGPPSGGVECKRGYEKSRFSTNISLYLGNGATVTMERQQELVCDLPNCVISNDVE